MTTVESFTAAMKERFYRMKVRGLDKKFPNKLVRIPFIVIVLCCCYLSAKRILNDFYSTEDDYSSLLPARVPLHAHTDIDSLKLIYSSNVCVYVKPKIIVLVTSHVSNTEVRDIIRRARPLDLFDKFSAQMVFMVAVPAVGRDRYETEKEFRKHGDLIQGEFVETYRNLTLKHLMGLRWVRDYCRTARYIVKMDDDIVANFYKLFEILNKFKRTSFDLLGHSIARMKPIRDVTNKWYVSEDEFSGSEYPTFVSGWLYMMTAAATASILKVANTVPYFWIDDVFVSGIVRERANLKLTDISNHFRYEPKNVECCVTNKYSCDFLAAPSGGQYSLHAKLSNHLWECRYKKLCLLESSLKKSCWFPADAFTNVSRRGMVKELGAAPNFYRRR